MTSSPIVVIAGARQTGKSSLVQHLAEREHRLYDSLDDLDTLELAGSNPDALVNRTGPMCFDDIQRSPSLLLSVKRAEPSADETHQRIAGQTGRLLRSAVIFSTGSAGHWRSRGLARPLRPSVRTDSDRALQGSGEGQELFYWRTTTGEEVDLVVECGGNLLPIEVETVTKPRIADARHLLAFRSEYKKASLPALLIHAGDEARWLADGVFAVPCEITHFDNTNFRV